MTNEAAMNILMNAVSENVILPAIEEVKSSGRLMPRCLFANFGKDEDRLINVAEVKSLSGSFPGMPFGMDFPNLTCDFYKYATDAAIRKVAKAVNVDAVIFASVTANWVIDKKIGKKLYGGEEAFRALLGSISQEEIKKLPGMIEEESVTVAVSSKFGFATIFVPFKEDELGIEFGDVKIERSNPGNLHPDVILFDFVEKK